MSVTTLMEHRHSQDWSKWAATAPSRTCKHCRREFAPNHPRRQACGQEDCGPIAAANATPVIPAAPPRARELSVQSLLGDILVHLHRADSPEGTQREVGEAMRLLLAAENSGRPIPRVVYTKLIAALTARALHLTSPE